MRKHRQFPEGRGKRARYGWIGQTAIVWLVAFVVAWKISRDQRVAFVGATVIGAALMLGLVAANRAR